MKNLHSDIKKYNTDCGGAIGSLPTCYTVDPGFDTWLGSGLAFFHEFYSPLHHLRKSLNLRRHHTTKKKS